ncbi:uncharacterized protein N7515_002083 [Penicillium bovifimosum]|uniref:Uncharacterized protein n=1 Tax=Penicillium bovifimosum TaxID=126998 RepID=A0A9W9L913_9EURO|nr:uncharacterized protein N7515_002083 [Penicillium bovifimosum]KAJ5143296.1 hypothetical protein N7515_002083 [Penicillium bovifimosum]
MYGSTDERPLALSFGDFKFLIRNSIKGMKNFLSSIKHGKRVDTDGFTMLEPRTRIKGRKASVLISHMPPATYDQFKNSVIFCRRTRGTIHENGEGRWASNE